MASAAKTIARTTAPLAIKGICEESRTEMTNTM
jgi:hypothetical protein